MSDENSMSVNYELESQDTFLEDLARDTYVPPMNAKERKQQLKEEKIQERQRAKDEKILQKELIKQSKQNKTRNDDETESLFGNEPTPIIGKEKTILLLKCKQYKSLFPELKTFKIKTNPSAKDLEDAIAEMSVIVETGGVNEFLEDSVIQCIKVLEGVSSVSPRTDVRGMSIMLESNPQFKKLCKVLFVKYGVYQNVPPEFQLILIVSTAAVLSNNKNKGKAQLDAYLSEKV